LSAAILDALWARLLKVTSEPLNRFPEFTGRSVPPDPTTELDDHSTGDGERNDVTTDDDRQGDDQKHLNKLINHR